MNMAMRRFLGFFIELIIAIVERLSSKYDKLQVQVTISTVVILLTIAIFIILVKILFFPKHAAQRTWESEEYLSWEDRCRKTGEVDEESEEIGHWEQLCNMLMDENRRMRRELARLNSRVKMSQEAFGFLEGSLETVIRDSKTTKEEYIKLFDQKESEILDLRSANALLRETAKNLKFELSKLKEELRSGEEKAQRAQRQMHEKEVIASNLEHKIQELRNQIEMEKFETKHLTQALVWAKQKDADRIAALEMKVKVQEEMETHREQEKEELREARNLLRRECNHLAIEGEAVESEVNDLRLRNKSAEKKLDEELNALEEKFASFVADFDDIDDIDDIVV